jgi:hypothetical protein
MLRYPYFDVVVGLVWSNDLGSYVGGSLATGSAFHARQVQGDYADKKGYSGPADCGLGAKLKIPPQNKKFVEKLLTLKTGWKQ